MSDPVTLGTMINGLISALSAYMTYKVGMEQAMQKGQKAPEKTKDVERGEQANKVIESGIQRFGQNGEKIALSGYYQNPDLFASVLKSAIENIASRESEFTKQLQSLMPDSAKQYNDLRGSTIHGVGAAYHSPITINNTISQQREPSAEELFDRGLNFLREKIYIKAMEELEKSLGLGYNKSDIYFYLALVSLRGSRPRLTSIHKVKIIEDYLREAINHDRRSNHSYVLWALVNEDYYIMGKLYDHQPTPDQLMSQVKSIGRDRVEEILHHINAPGNKIWEYLRGMYS